MEKHVHPLRELFNQLGLPSDNAAIDGFVARHGPLSTEVRLSEAPFWTEQQARFLSEAVRDDADWAPIVDQLDVLLRKQPA
jgi:hypothetical protein